MGWKYKTDDGEVEIQVSKELLLVLLAASKSALSDYAVGIEPAPPSVSFAMAVLLRGIDHAVSVVERHYAPPAPDRATIDKIWQHAQDTTTQQETTGSEES